MLASTPRFSSATMTLTRNPKKIDVRITPMDGKPDIVLQDTQGKQIEKFEHQNVNAAIYGDLSSKQSIRTILEYFTSPKIYKQNLSWLQQNFVVALGDLNRQLTGLRLTQSNEQISPKEETQQQNYFKYLTPFSETHRQDIRKSDFTGTICQKAEYSEQQYDPQTHAFSFQMTLVDLPTDIRHVA
jgi:hypothetical protein